MRVVHVLRSLGGAARREELLARGCAVRDIGAAIKANAVFRPHRGVYVLPEAPRDLVAAAVFRAQLTCLTACERLGLPLLATPSRPHLGVEYARSVSRPGLRDLDQVVLHRHDVHSLPVRGVPSAFDAIDSAGWCASPLQQLVLVDAALHQDLVRFRDLAALACTDAVRGAWLRRFADARAQSPLETLARYALVRSGFSVEPQVLFEGIGWVDLLVEGVVVVETDGRRYHSADPSFQRDRDRDAELQMLGLAVLRFTYADVVGRPDKIVSRVRRTLDARGVS